jgi:hypothetical protein
MVDLPERLPASLPGVESKLLCRAVIEACERINNGDPEAGYQCLLAGLERAADYAEAGAEWAAGLAHSYREALAQAATLRPGPRADRGARR